MSVAGCAPVIAPKSEKRAVAEPRVIEDVGKSGMVPIAIASGFLAPRLCSVLFCSVLFCSVLQVKSGAMILHV